MRLIDADEFKKQIAAAIIRENLIAEKGNAMCNLVDKQPTAYDMDKVVEQLEEFKTSIWSETLEENIDVVNLERVKKIVKSGGIE